MLHGCFSSCLLYGFNYSVTSAIPRSESTVGESPWGITGVPRFQGGRRWNSASLLWRIGFSGERRRNDFYGSFPPGFPAEGPPAGSAWIATGALVGKPRPRNNGD